MNPRKKYKEIIMEFNSGLSVKELSTKYNISEEVITNTLRYRYNDKVDTTKLYKDSHVYSEKNRNIIKDYVFGRPISEITKENGISRARVYQILTGVDKRRKWVKSVTVTNNQAVVNKLRESLANGDSMTLAAFRAGIGTSSAYAMAKAYDLRKVRIYKKKK